MYDLTNLSMFDIVLNNCDRIAKKYTNEDIFNIIWMRTNPVFVKLMDIRNIFIFYQEKG